MRARTPRTSVASELPNWVRSQLRRELGRRLCRAGRRLGLTPEEIEGVSVHIVDDSTIARLNHEHMGKRGPTDVLSFPSATTFVAISDDSDGQGGAPPSPALGDIVISWPAILRQATGTGDAAYLDEATVLAIHGLSHLLGHDHGGRREGRAMHLLELRALAAARVADIPRPYGLRPSLHRR